jgi:hypothetical protein
MPDFGNDSPTCFSFDKAKVVDEYVAMGADADFHSGVNRGQVVDQQNFSVSVLADTCR